MTHVMSQENQHISDLLPAYVNGRLDAARSEQVRAHLSRCASCQQELSSWQAISEATHMADAALPLPSSQVMENVWAAIDTPAMKTQGWTDMVKQAALHLWLVFKKQIPLIHKSIWIATPLVNVLMCVLVFLSLTDSQQHIRNIESVLALFSTVTTAVGTAFLYQAEREAGYEVLLSTPTSIRLVMICRMILVIGYNFALTALSSAIIAYALGGNFLDFMRIWFGPMILLASFSLAVSVTLGSIVGVVVSLLLEASQSLISSLERVAFIHFIREYIWQTTPLTLLIALLLIVFAILYAPRQPRLSS